jgi:hypothetical protein
MKDAVRFLRLRRRRTDVPGVFLLYHAPVRDTAEVAPGAAQGAAPGIAGQGGELACESGFALPPEERRDIERRGRLELGAGPHVVRRRTR